MDAGRGLDTMGPNISRSLFWLVLVLPLLVAAAVGASGTERERERRENQLNQFHMCQTFAQVRKTHPHGTVYCSDEKGHESLTESRLDLDPVRN